MTQVSIRYIVRDVPAAIDFYTEQLGFELRANPAPPFAILERGPLRLLLNDPSGGGGAGQPAADGSVPEPGGWNRLVLEVGDLDEAVSGLQKSGGRVRTEPVTGKGGRQAVIEDPSGNAVELLEPQA
jgi:predicted enzyme related to lactoylglutathione lyase